MSYCRWSSDNWRSDVYCYESDAGFETHVAGRRIVGDIPQVNMEEILTDMPKFQRDYNAQMAFLDTCTREPIGLAFDGESYVDPDLPSFLQRLTDLREAGYNVPDHVFEDIRQEMAT